MSSSTDGHGGSIASTTDVVTPLVQNPNQPSPSAPSSSNIVSEFMKRRNWTQQILEGIRDFLHVLTPDGRLIYVSPSSKLLTGYAPEELIGKYIRDYVHPDDSTLYIREFNESIASGKPLRFFYRFRKQDSSYTIFETHGHPHMPEAAGTYGPNASGLCRGFFMMARPYPTKNAALLDTFLEHKMENERLTRRIAELRKEEQDDLESSQSQSQSQSQSSNRSWSISGQHASNPPPDSLLASLGPSSATSTQIHVPALAGTTMSMSMPMNTQQQMAMDGGNALTEQNLGLANTRRRHDSISDKMEQYRHDGSKSHYETIELMTGLRYREGERSEGISTGDASPALIQGDMGIAIPLDKEARGDSSGGRKKKLKSTDEYVCTDCGTLDSPEWRKGPNGPKSLCNACGLRWAKKERKRQNQASSAQDQTQTQAPVLPSVQGNFSPFGPSS